MEKRYASQYLLNEVGFPMFVMVYSVKNVRSQYLLNEVGFPIRIEKQSDGKYKSQYLLNEVGFPMDPAIFSNKSGMLPIGLCNFKGLRKVKVKTFRKHFFY